MTKEDIIIALIKSENAATRAEVSNMIVASGIATSQSIESMNKTLKEHNGRLRESEESVECVKLSQESLKQTLEEHTGNTPNRLALWATKNPKVSVIILVFVLFVFTVLVEAFNITELLKLVK